MTTGIQQIIDELNHKKDAPRIERDLATLTESEVADLHIIEHELTDALALLLELSVTAREMPRLTAARRLLLNCLTRAKRINSRP